MWVARLARCGTIRPVLGVVGTIIALIECGDLEKATIYRTVGMTALVSSFPVGAERLSPRTYHRNMSGYHH